MCLLRSNPLVPLIHGIGEDQSQFANAFLPLKHPCEINATRARVTSMSGNPSNWLLLISKSVLYVWTRKRIVIVDLAALWGAFACFCLSSTNTGSCNLARYTPFVGRKFTRVTNKRASCAAELRQDAINGDMQVLGEGCIFLNKSLCFTLYAIVGTRLTCCEKRSVHPCEWRVVLNLRLIASVSWAFIKKGAERDTRWKQRARCHWTELNLGQPCEEWLRQCWVYRNKVMEISSSHRMGSFGKVG